LNGKSNFLYSNETEKFKSDENSNESKSDDSINTTENWRGKGIEEKLFKKEQRKEKRKTKYMDPAKDIDRILSIKKTRSTYNNLLING